MDVAIVGIGCRLPGGADTPGRCWDLLAGGVDAVTEVPPERFDAASLYDPDPAKPGRLSSRWGGFVEGIDRFDAAFWGISPREARRVDPQQRLLLEVVWEALEDGGQPPDRLGGSSTGVFVGASTHDYADIQRSATARDLIDAHVGTGGALSLIANRVSYLLDLRGPSLVVDTACSSSLTAVHLACRSLAVGESDLAIAGGTNVILVPEPAIMFTKASMLSPDGRCKPFDASADGYVRSEGAAAVVLKPLDHALRDRDPVYAVILATAVNQDGRTAGITVPNPAAQQELLRTALADARVHPADVQYVEAHGTGTAVGDPREAAAIGDVFSAGRAAGNPLVVGSVKGNVGHLEAAAGITGLVKTALALRHRWIPPTLHFREANPAIPFDLLRLRVATTGQPWPAAPGRAVATVNAFGFGGANAAVVVAEAPPPAESPPADPRRAHALTLSARSQPALRQSADAWVARLREPDPPSLADLCYTAAVRRSHHGHRVAVVGTSRAEVAEGLEAFLAGEPHPGLVAGHEPPDGTPKLAFVFPGMGPQWTGMTRRLLADEPVFRAGVAACDDALAPLAGWSILEELAAEPTGEAAPPADRAHVLNLAVQFALTGLWRSWGVEPGAVVGHSSGETTAALVAGVLPLTDAVRLAFHRGRLLHTRTGAGGMLAAGISASDAQALARENEPRVCVAAVNGPGSVTMSGDAWALAAIAGELHAKGRWCRQLDVRIPYHSPQLDVLEGELRACLGDLDHRPPALPVVSTTTGDWVDGQALDTAHWWRILRQPVLFAAAVDRLVDDGFELFVEVGPHPVLLQSVLECLTARGVTATLLPTLRRDEDERRTMLRAAAALHARGRRIEWPAVYRGGRCVPVPAYPWQRERYWFDERPPGDRIVPAAREGSPPGRRLPAAAPTWEVDLADPRLAYLDGHRVRDTATVPAAAYVVLGLAAAGALDGGPPLALEQVEFHSAMGLDERDGVRLQTRIDPQALTLEIHSAPASGDRSWKRRAGGRVARPRPDRSPPPLALAAARERCRHALPADVFYRIAEADQGLSYRGAFRGVTEVWCGTDEALARIVPQAGADLAAGGDPVHPALLDAAFHALLAAIAFDLTDVGSGATLLPVGVRRVEWHARPDGPFWSHATVRRRDGAAVDGTVRLVDDTGRVLVSCEGLRLEAVGTRRTQLDGFLREEVWEALPPRPVPTPAPRAGGAEPPGPIADAVRGLLARFADEEAFTDYYTVVEPAANATALQLTRRALTELGWDPRADADVDADALADRLGVVVRHRRYLARLLEHVAALSGGGRVAGGRRAEAPTDPLADRADVRPGVELLRGSGRRLAATLRGDEDARGWLIAGDAARALAAFYAETPSGRFYNRALAELIARAGPSDRGLRILEVGAGTGATTAAVLARVGDRVDDYLFTDVSPFFVKRARSRFAGHPAVRFGVVDIEQEPARLEGAFDIVVAADVVHAASDLRATLDRLRRCLGPGGLAVLLEPVRRSPWLELVFGQFEGWWSFTDTDLRPAHPLLTTPQWERVLTEAGYVDAVAVADDPPGGGDPMQVLLAARNPALVPARATGGVPARRWVVLGDRRGVGDRVAAALRDRGDRCTLVRAGTAYREPATPAGAFEVVPTSEEDWARLLETVATNDGAPWALVHLWSLDAPPTGELTTAALMAFQERSCGALVTLLRAARSSGSALGGAWLVTSGAQPVRPDHGELSVAQAPMWGLGRVLRNEHGGQRCRLVDIDAAADGADALLAELGNAPATETPEAELAVRDGQRYSPRLRRPWLGPTVAPGPRRRRSPDTSVFRLEVAAPGGLEALGLREVQAVHPRAGEVAVRVHAASLNFRDVLVTLGMLPADGRGRRLGLDCAGTVVACEGTDAFRPGDEVVAIAHGALASRVVTRADLAAPKPPSLSFEAAAALPAAYVTAHASLHGLARLASGERVLVHAATGGVGLAALELCRRAGAQVFATAGTPEKRAHLASLGVEHVMDSRSLRFADEVLAATGGEGVDVVLNSLVGEARVRGLGLLRQGGRFVDLAVRDLHEDAPLGLRPFVKGLAYHSFGDPGEPFPTAWGHALRAVVRDVDAGSLRPLPHTDFDLGDATQAVRLLAQARHVGKVVVRVGEPHYWAETDAPLFNPEATYLIVGGLGGFGLATAAWMVRRGARHLALTSRSGAPGRDEEAALRHLRASAATVTSFAADAADRGAMAAVLRRIRATMPPLKGVMHAAMTLDDDLLGRLDHDRFRAVLAPKVAGGWNLHELTLTDELDLFVLFSSASSLIGVPTQGNYAAANAFLDALATHRHDVGLPALTVNWGALAGTGYVARHPELQEVSTRVGVDAIPPGIAFAGLEKALRSTRSRLAIGRVDWDRWPAGGTGVRGPAHGPGDRAAADRGPVDDAGGGARIDVGRAADQPELLEAHVIRRAAMVLETTPDRVEPDQPLSAMGLDSLMAVELQAMLERDVGLQLPLVELLEGVSVRRLVARIIEQHAPGTG